MMRKEPMFLFRGTAGREQGTLPYDRDLLTIWAPL
jgi:hypothetical protein